jgi:3-hydroxyisobutyrate dehydrogenase-like beta-hydroxyacid dehydrogenase
MEAARLGFVGLGVMGEPMCRNLARKSGRSVVAWDIRREPLDRLAADGVKAAGSLRELLLNNMVLSVTVMALAEALAVAKASGAVDPKVLFETLAKGSADSFALRNHGMKALLPETHPEKAFPVSYMMKDVAYALDLARSAGLRLPAGETVFEVLKETREMGLGEAYHTAIIEAIRKRRSS